MGMREMRKIVVLGGGKRLLVERVGLLYGLMGWFVGVVNGSVVMNNGVVIMSFDTVPRIERLI